MTNENSIQQKQQVTWSKKVWIAGSIVLLLVIFFMLFNSLFNVLLLTLAGTLFAIYFHSFADMLERYLRISKSWGLALSIVVNIFLFAAFLWFIGGRLQQQVSSLTDTLPKTINNAKAYMQQSLIGNKVLEYLDSSGNSVKTISIVKKFFSSTFGILSDLYIIILMGMFFIASPFTYKKGIVHLMPPQAKDRADNLLNEIHTILKNWIKGQLFGFMFIAVLTGLALWAIGMPLVLTLALIAGLLNFIPNFGPIIALVPAVLIALTMGSTTAILVVTLYTFIQIIQSAVTQPLIQKKMMSIPPALTISAR